MVIEKGLHRRSRPIVEICGHRRLPASPAEATDKGMGKLRSPDVQRLTGAGSLTGLSGCAEQQIFRIASAARSRV